MMAPEAPTVRDSYSYEYEYIPFQKKGVPVQVLVRAQRITFFGRVYGEKSEWRIDAQRYWYSTIPVRSNSDYPAPRPVPPVSIYAQELYVELEFTRIHSEERRAVFWFLYTYCGNR